MSDGMSIHSGTSVSRSMGIEVLGKLYRDATSLDDTDMKLGLGRSNATEGNLDSASYLFQGESRLELYRRVHCQRPKD